MSTDTIPSVHRALSVAGDDAAGRDQQVRFRHRDDSGRFQGPQGAQPKRSCAQISEMKGEPELDARLPPEVAGEIFESKPMPEWGGDINIDFDDVYYYLKPTERPRASRGTTSPRRSRRPSTSSASSEAERKRFLAGVKAQFESEVVYGSLQEDLAKKGVIFTDTDTAVKEHPELLREYFGTIIPPEDNKFAALNSAVWSGGSFIYVPPGVHIDFPLQAYFRINAESMGQFERTLIIVDEGASVHYVEGCTAPMYSTESLHSAVVEVVVKKNGRARYTTIQNWANNIYNLVTKRAVAYQDALMEWVDGNLGSATDDEVPGRLHDGAGRPRRDPLDRVRVEGAAPRRRSAKVVHCAPNTSSRIISKSISKNGGRAGYRGLCKVEDGATELEEQRRLRRAHPRPGEPQPTRTPTSRSRSKTSRSSTRLQRLADRRGAALLPHEPRADRGRGELDDRLGLHRAARSRSCRWSTRSR